MARPWWAPIVVVLATLSSVSACIDRAPVHVDPVYTIGVINESAEPVIVRFASGDRGVLVQPGGRGLGAQDLGELTGPIRVFDLACRLIQSVPVTTQRGFIVVGANREARLVQADDVPTAALEMTDQCAE